MEWREDMAVLEKYKHQASVLVATWRSREFWAHNAIHLVPVGFGILFWWRVVVSVFHGMPPLLGWMISAYLSVWLTSVVVSRIFAGIAEPQRRYGPAMLLMQFAIILVANTFVIALMVALGMYFREADLLVVASATFGLAVVAPFVLTRRIGAASDWALCGYSVSLKSAPQVVQAYSIFKGLGKLDLWSAVFLFCQGLSRWWISLRMWQSDRTSVRARSQLTNASCDLATIMLIGGAVLYHTPLQPAIDIVVDFWLRMA